MQKKDLRVIGCGIMKEELTHAPSDGVSFIFLEQSLHRTPQKMKETIQEEINKADMREGNSIILSYGLCSNGIVGIKASHQSIIIPKVHDCITLFLGSNERYFEEHKKEPGTYYLTKGWIEEKKSPLGIYEEYCQRYAHANRHRGQAHRRPAAVLAVELSNHNWACSRGGWNCPMTSTTCFAWWPRDPAWWSRRATIGTPTRPYRSNDRRSAVAWTVGGARRIDCRNTRRLQPFPGRAAGGVLEMARAGRARADP